MLLRSIIQCEIRKRNLKKQLKSLGWSTDKGSVVLNPSLWGTLWAKPNFRCLSGQKLTNMPVYLRLEESGLTDACGHVVGTCSHLLLKDRRVIYTWKDGRRIFRVCIANHGQQHLHYHAIIDIKNIKTLLWCENYCLFISFLFVVLSCHWKLSKHIFD